MFSFFSLPYSHGLRGACAPLPSSVSSLCIYLHADSLCVCNLHSSTCRPRQTRQLRYSLRRLAIRSAFSSYFMFTSSPTLFLPHPRPLQRTVTSFRSSCPWPDCAARVVKGRLKDDFCYRMGPDDLGWCESLSGGGVVLSWSWLWRSRSWSWWSVWW